ILIWSSEHSLRILSLRQTRYGSNCLATDGKGIALLPLLKCKSLILEKKLIVVLPEWELPTGNFHLIFPSRSGALPASKVFLDFLIEKIPPLLKEMQDI
ncbi:LysR substrate-binding domain-containing protein, partial [Acinetobacter baumannii]|uniref:LysR substrate-binding domain-containing protein n=1 Tax=Acinetobacter baumannii TaxID=470 RepID=UPI001FFCF2C9